MALLLDETELEQLDDEKGFKLVAAFFQELEKYHISLCRDEISDVHNDADYLAGFLYWIDEERDGRADEDILAKVFSAEVAQSFVAWHPRQSITDLPRFYLRYILFRSFHSTYSMFRTCKGSFGITEAGAAPGDTLWPLVGRLSCFGKSNLQNICWLGQLMRWPGHSTGN